MTLRDLSHLEMLALVGLMEYVIMADNFLTDDEEEQLQTVMHQIGHRHYEELIDEFDSQYADESDFRSLLESITRQEVREVIYGTILGAANANVLFGKRHDELLDWLVKEWGIDVRIADDDVDQAH
jgi:hypothetical protein